MSERKSRKSSRGEVNYNTMSPKDKKKKFIEDTLKLQTDQNKIQMEFADKVEKQIKIFKKKFAVRLFQNQ